jgi:alkyl hydroperoxide reductase subunit D
VVGQQTELTEQQLWGALVASAVASRNEQLIAAVLEEAATHLTPEALDAAKAAAAIMGMNNVFYRFKHLTSNEKYSTMRSGLRMNVMRTHGIDPLDFELWATVVSAINNCGSCVDAHERKLREKGMSEEKILAAVRVAAVVYAIAVVLDTETASVPQPVGA